MTRFSRGLGKTTMSFSFAFASAVELGSACCCTGGVFVLNPVSKISVSALVSGRDALSLFVVALSLLGATPVFSDLSSTALGAPSSCCGGVTALTAHLRMGGGEGLLLAERLAFRSLSLA